MGTAHRVGMRAVHRDDQSENCVLAGVGKKQQVLHSSQRKVCVPLPLVRTSLAVGIRVV